MTRRMTYTAECGHEVTSSAELPRKRFCSFACSKAEAHRRGTSFAEATSRPAGKPPDGVTYGKGKAS